MFLSRDLGIAFFRNPRTGSRAIRSLLLPYCDIGEVGQKQVSPEKPFYKHIPPREAKPLLEGMGVDWDKLRKFTVVRNPFTRLVSYYHWRLERWKMVGKPPKDFKRHLLKEVEPDHIMAGSIIHYAGDGNGTLLVDEIIRHEGLSENLERLFSRWNVPIDTSPMRIVGASPAYDLANYYDDECIDFVLKNYDFEFSELGYPRTPSG